MKMTGHTALLLGFLTAFDVNQVGAYGQQSRPPGRRATMFPIAAPCRKSPARSLRLPGHLPGVGPMTGPPTGPLTGAEPNGKGGNGSTGRSGSGKTGSAPMHGAAPAPRDAALSFSVLEMPKPWR